MMSKKLKNKINNHIIKKINLIEKYSKKLIKNDIDYIDEIITLPIYGLNLDSLSINKPTREFKEYTNENLFDIKFEISYDGTAYIFETSNYYFHESSNTFYTEDLFENIDTLINRFEFLLEYEDYIFDETEEDDDGYGKDYYIDDNDNWQWIDREYTDIEMFVFDLDYKNGYTIYDNSDETGKFYWKED